MKRKPLRRSSTISSTTASLVRTRGFCPSVRHTEQNEQCFGQPAHRLHGRPHVAIGRQQIPARLEHRAALDATAFVDRAAGFRRVHALIDERPDAIAVTLDDRVRPAELQRLIRIKRRVDAAVDNLRAALARQAADLVAAQGVAAVDADADNVAGLNRIRVQLLRGFRRR